MAFVSISAQMSLWSHRGHAKAGDYSAACGCSVAALWLHTLLRFAAGCWFPSNVKHLRDLQPAAFELWPATVLNVAIK